MASGGSWNWRRALNSMPRTVDVILKIEGETMFETRDTAGQAGKGDA